MLINIEEQILHNILGDSANCQDDQEYISKYESRLELLTIAFAKDT